MTSKAVNSGKCLRRLCFRHLPKDLNPGRPQLRPCISLDLPPEWFWLLMNPWSAQPGDTINGFFRSQLSAMRFRSAGVLLPTATVNQAHIFRRTSWQFEAECAALLLELSASCPLRLSSMPPASQPRRAIPNLKGAAILNY